MQREEIKAKIPHGYGKKIAERAGVDVVSVSRFINGHSNSIKIEMAALEVISEMEQQKKSLIAKIQ